jgi:hypothetical protein
MPVPGAIARSLLLLALLAIPARASVTGRLNGVVVEQQKTGAAVRIVCEGSFEYDSYTLHSPERLVVELTGITKHFAAAIVPGGAYPIKQVRLAQLRSRSTPAARLIVDLDGEASARVERVPEGVVVRFGAGPTNAPPIEIKTEWRPSSPAPRPQLDLRIAGAATHVRHGARIESEPEEVPSPQPSLDVELEELSTSVSGSTPRTIEVAEHGSLALAALPATPVASEPEPAVAWEPVPEIDPARTVEPASHPAPTVASRPPAEVAPDLPTEPKPVIVVASVPADATEPMPGREIERQPSRQPAVPSTPERPAPVPDEPIEQRVMSTSQSAARSARSVGSATDGAPRANVPTHRRSRSAAGGVHGNLTVRGGSIAAASTTLESGYAVMVLESSERAEANSWRSRLTQSGERAFIKIYLEGHRGPRFRVLVGRFDDYGEALRAVERIGSEHAVRGRVLEEG